MRQGVVGKFSTFLLTRKQKNGSFLTRCFPLSLYLFTFIVFMPVVLDGHVSDVWIGIYLLERAETWPFTVLVMGATPRHFCQTQPWYGLPS